MKKVVIIGYGVVGKHFEREIIDLKPEIEDRFKGYNAEKCRYDFGFICVDTPLKDGKLDVSQVVNALNENDCTIYVIKSTLPVGTTQRLAELTGKRIVFSPEFYGGTQHCNNFRFHYTILGGKKQNCIEVVQLLQDAYDARHSFKIVDSKTAEMTKLMSNSWLATKVMFCNSFYRACKEAGVSYEMLRELFILDPRINPAHTFVYEEHPYYESHCLDKDVPAVANQFDIELLKEVVALNEKFKDERL